MLTITQTNQLIDNFGIELLALEGDGIHILTALEAIRDYKGLVPMDEDSFAAGLLYEIECFKLLYFKAIKSPKMESFLTTFEAFDQQSSKKENTFEWELSSEEAETTSPSTFEWDLSSDEKENVPSLPLSNPRPEAVQENAKEADLEYEIKKALKQARTKYYNWFNAMDETSVARGPNTFFTSWFNHGVNGQISARDFNKKAYACTSLEALVYTINEKLKDPKTAYHRHSYVSFMLDELRKIKDSEGNLICPFTPDAETMRYDKEDIIKSLDAQAMHEEGKVREHFVDFA